MENKVNMFKYTDILVKVLRRKYIVLNEIIAMKLLHYKEAHSDRFQVVEVVYVCVCNTDSRDLERCSRLTNTTLCVSRRRQARHGIGTYRIYLTLHKRAHCTKEDALITNYSK